MITGEVFKKRLSDFFSSWRSTHKLLWGFSDIIVVSTAAAVAVEASWNLRSRDFFLWLLGEDVAGTTAVFTPSSIFFLCTHESFSGLCRLRGYAMRAMNIRVSVELLINPDDGVSKLDGIIIECRRDLSCCRSSCLTVGCIDSLIIESKVLNDFQYFSQYMVVDVDRGVRKLIGQDSAPTDSSRINKEAILMANYMLLEFNAIKAMEKAAAKLHPHPALLSGGGGGASFENYKQSSPLIKEMKYIYNMSLGDEAGTSSNSNEEEEDEEMKLYSKEAANKQQLKIKQRLTFLYSSWRKYRKELWGDSDVLVVTSGSESGSMATHHHHHHHPVSCSFFLWLLGRDFPNITAVFMEQAIYFICPIETCPQLCLLGLYMATAQVVIHVSVEPRLKADDDESQVLNFSTLYHAVDDRDPNHPHPDSPVIIGYIHGEALNSKFLDPCGCLVHGKRFQATNVISGFVKLLNEVEEEEDHPA